MEGYSGLFLVNVNSKSFEFTQSTKNERESCSVKLKTLYTRLWLNYGLL